MQSFEHHHHNDGQSELIAYFEKNVLNISLKELNAMEPQSFYSTLKDKELPTEVKNHLEGTQFVFECLKSPQNHQVDSKHGKINLKTHYTFTNKILEKQSTIKLNKAQKNLQSLSSEIYFLKKELEIIKKNGSPRYQSETTGKNFEQEIQQLKRENIENKASILKLKKDNEEKEDQIFVMTEYLEKLKEKLEIFEIKEKISDEQTEKNKQESVISKRPIMEEKLLLAEKELVSKYNLEFDLKSRFAKRFQVIDRAITYLGEDKRRTQFFVKNSVNPEGKSFSFSWKVRKSQNSSLIFGLVDINKQKDARTSYDSGYAIAYNGLNGNVCYQKGKTISGGKGLKEGETIKMEVNLETQKVMWSCGSEIRGIVDGSMLKEKGRNFVPYVEIYDKEDCIEWIN